jgi:hypothetical protein
MSCAEYDKKHLRKVILKKIALLSEKMKKDRGYTPLIIEDKVPLSSIKLRNDSDRKKETPFPSSFLQSVQSSPLWRNPFARPKTSFLSNF